MPEMHCRSHLHHWLVAVALLAATLTVLPDKAAASGHGEGGVRRRSPRTLELMRERSAGAVAREQQRRAQVVTLVLQASQASQSPAGAASARHCEHAGRANEHAGSWLLGRADGEQRAKQ
jgi:hypothetical protein